MRGLRGKSSGSRQAYLSRYRQPNSFSVVDSRHEATQSPTAFLISPFCQSPNAGAMSC